MKLHSLPLIDASRLATLHTLTAHDTRAEERFARHTRLARHVFDVPIALVRLVDTEWQCSKSPQDPSASQIEHEASFCAHAILCDAPLIVPDTRSDLRFAGSPMVIGEPGVRFYAGCPLKAVDGGALGTLCLMDSRPRRFRRQDRIALSDLARIVEQELGALALATVDELTGLSNRRGFRVVAAHALSLCDRLAEPAALLFFDLDGFKQVNDRFGHAEGDSALAEVATLLAEVFRNSDVIARLGGDEFCVLLTGTSERDAHALLRRFDTALGERNREQRLRYALTYSVGVVAYASSRHAGVDDLLAEADRLMYEQKAAHRRVRTHSVTAHGGLGA